VGPAARPPLTSRRRVGEAVLVVLAALAVSGGLMLLGDPDLRADQNAYNLLVARKLDPGLFARDALYRHDPDLLHVPWFLDLHAALARRLGGDVERALAWLGWLIGAGFIGGHYVFFRAVAARAGPAALATLGAVTLRNTLGGEVWGFDGIASAATRTILAGLVPPLLLLFLRARASRWLPAYWGLLGALFNVHPVSAYHLAQVTAVAHLWRERFRRRALVQVALGVALFVVGALPYVVPFFAGREGGGAPAVVRAALDYRFPYLFYPIAPNALLSVAFHMALPLAAWLWWRRRGEPHAVLTPLAPVMAAAVVLGFGGTALIQAVGAWRDRPYVDIQELRVLRLLYPMLLGGLALLYARRLAAPRGRAWIAAGALFVASLVPPASVIHAFSHETRGAVKHALGFGPRPVPAAAVDRAPRLALWAWTASATPPDALVFTDDFEFRLRTRRAITGSFKDGAFMFLAGSGPLAAWYTLERERAACRAAGGAGCWFDLARRLGADYAVLDPDLARAAAAPPADFERVWARDGWSVWRRRGAA
jgi:hypothetical protein